MDIELNVDGAKKKVDKVSDKILAGLIRSNWSGFISVGVIAASVAGGVLLCGAGVLVF